MSLSDKSSERQFFMKFSAPSETTLLGIIVVCFLILHVAAFMLLTPARQSDAVGPPQPASLSRGD